MVRGHDEGHYFFHRHSQAQQIGQPQPGVAPGAQDAVHIAHAESGHAQQDFARGLVDVGRESRSVAERPRKLGVELQVEIWRSLGGDFVHLEAVEAQQPVRLIKPMLAHERRRLEGQQRRRIRNWTEPRVIHAPQPVIAVEHIRASQDDGVCRIIRAHEHLRALPSRKRRGLRRIRLPLFRVSLVDFFADMTHRSLRAREVFFRREFR